MSSSLSKFVHNLSEGIPNNKCADCKCNLEYIKTKNEKLILEVIIASNVIERNLIKN